MKKQKISGFIMAVIGFLMLLINAISYLFHLDIKTSCINYNWTCLCCNRNGDC